MSCNARLLSQSHSRLAAGPHPSPISDAHLSDANPFFDALRPLRGRQAWCSEHRAQHAAGHRIELGHGGSHCGRDACSSWPVALRPHGTQAFAGPHAQEELLGKGRMRVRCALIIQASPCPSTLPLAGFPTTSISVSCSATSSTLKSRSSGPSELRPSSSAKSSANSDLGDWAALGGAEK